MNPEDLIINVIMQLGDAKRQVAALEQQLAAVTGVTNAMHKQAVQGAQQATQHFEFEKLAVGKLTAHVGELAAEFTIATLTVKEFTTAAQGMNALVQELGAIHQSGGMLITDFAEMKKGIIEAGVVSGHTFEQMAEMAKSIVGETGLRQGVGDIVKSAALMERAFGGSADQFALMAADVQKLSRGLMTGSDTMRIFDNVVGVTGKRMDELVANLHDISKTLGHIVGGGKGFATAFGGTAKFIAETSGLIDKLGGNASEFQDLVKGVLDPRRWSEIAHQIPGITSFLPQLQAALSSGDMETAVKLFQQAGKNTTAAFGNLSPMAAQMMGLNKNLAEVLAQVDMAKLQQQASTTESVMDRAQSRILGFGQGLQRLWNTLALPIMDRLGFVAEKFLGVVNAITDTLGRHPIANEIVTWGLFAAAVLGAVQAFIMFKTAAATAGTAMQATSAAIGSSITSISAGVGAGIRSVMVGAGEGLAALAAGLVALTPAIPVMLVLGGIFAVGMVALGFALRLATPAIEAMSKMNGADMLGAAAGMVVMAAALPMLGAGFVVLGTGMLLGSVGVAAFAAAARLFGPLKGGGVGTVLQGIAESFSFKGERLSAIIDNMRMMRTFLKEFVVISAEVAAMSAGAALATAVEKVLSVFGIDSPMAMLAARGAEVAQTISSLMTSFSVLVAKGGEGTSAALAGAMTNASAFIKQLGPLIDAMVELGNHSSKLEDGFLSNGPLTKIAKNINGDALSALRDLTISAKTDAEIALNGYQQATQQHQGRVEELLENILEAVKVRPAMAAAAEPRGRDWDPSNAFTQFADGEW